MSDGMPDTEVSVREVFNIDCDWTVPAYKTRTEHVPELDEDYLFDGPTTRAILAGFAHNRRVMVSGYHGTGKSTHIEQVAARLDGILPWAYQNNVALVFDEYDAGRPDVMFVIQRVLESSGRLTLLDQSRVITPHPAFRLFATANTVGLGDTTGWFALQT